MYIFVALPQSKQKSLQTVKDAISTFADSAQFTIPQFKIGTLDSLIVTADELARIDSNIELVVNKLVDNIRNLLEGKDVNTALLINDKPVDAYLKSFSWNTVKYRIDKSVKEISEVITQEVSTTDTMIKNKLNTFNATKNALLGIERKSVGSLAVKSLVDIVKKEHVILDSEYLKTVIVAVPNAIVADFYGVYEKLANMVVPRSATKIAADEEYTLFGIAVFQKTHDELIGKLRENKFIPRDFVFDEAILAKDRKEYADLGASAKEQWAMLLRLCRSNFGELFTAWIHIKALRVFVESVLRYGLPPTFLGAIIKPKTKQDKRVFDILAKNFSDLASKAARGNGKEDAEDIPEFAQDKNYRPYVCFDMELAWEKESK